MQQRGSDSVPPYHAHAHRHPAGHSSNSRIIGGHGLYDAIQSASPASMTPARLLL